MNKLLCSVIIPAYNAEKTIIRCLESFHITKKEKGIEILVINDGSTDKTKALVENYFVEYSNCRIVTKENGGVSSARNLGILLAKGTYIYFCDSDDTINREALDKMIATAVNMNCDLVGAPYNNESDSRIIGIESIKTNILIDREMIVREVIPLFILGKGSSAVWNKLYKKRIITENALVFDEKMRIGEDLFFNLNFLDKTSSMYMIEIPIYNYYCDNNQGHYEKYGIKNAEDILAVHKKRIELNKKYNCFPEESIEILNEHKTFICLCIGVLELDYIGKEYKNSLLDNSDVTESIRKLLSTKQGTLNGWTRGNRFCMLLLKHKMWKLMERVNYAFRIPIIPSSC